MRILVLTIEYPPLGGGASPMIHELNKQFVSLGHEVTTVTMAHNELASEEFVEGIKVYRIKCFRAHTHISFFWEHVAFLLGARKFLSSYVQRHPVDFCYTHFLVPTGMLTKWLHNKYQIPYVITAHGSDIPGFNPDRFNFIHRFTPPLLRSIINRSSYIVSPSLYLKNLIFDIQKIKPEKITHIPNGINTDLFIPGFKKPMILSTGRLLPRKGFQYLIEAVSDESFPFEVHICGAGPMMNELKEKAKNSMTPVIFHGWVDNKSEMYRSLLAEASIFCLVSAKENASISLLEALSSGCAVITSDVSGCPESVGDAGICIPPEDVPALKKQLRIFAEKPEFLSQLQKQGRERAVREFSWPSIAARYLALMPEKDPA
jgi:glycosyltransferase involved in cell wall biosynthesis